MTSSRKRPWFRFHLLTAVVMMFAAGAMVWANIVPSRHEDGNGYLTHPYLYDLDYGWPGMVVRHLSPINPKWVDFQDSKTIIQWPKVCGNVIICLMLLLLSAIGSEFLIRRRESRKT